MPTSCRQGNRFSCRCTPFQWIKNTGGGGYCQGGAVATNTLIWRPVYHEGQTPQDVDSCGNTVGRYRPRKLGEGFIHHSGGLQGGKIAASCVWQTVVMIPKGGGTDFRVIGLVEVLWKAISSILNRRVSYSIHFHHALHGFLSGRDQRPPPSRLSYYGSSSL